MRNNNGKYIYLYNNNNKTRGHAGGISLFQGLKRIIRSLIETRHTAVRAC